MASDEQEPMDPHDGPAAPERTSSTWPLYLLLVVAAATLVVLQMRRPRPENAWIGQPLPPIEATGWLHADEAVTNESLRGKLVLVDYWETTCPECVFNMPELVKLKDRFREQGLVVIGLTPEQDRPFGQLTRYVENVPGLDWPIGYGAGFTMHLAGVEFLPTYVLYDGAGRAVWGGHDLDELDDAIVEHLARG
jgi:thiol-disulfide isomerase/thioredoxin